MSIFPLPRKLGPKNGNFRLILRAIIGITTWHPWNFFHLLQIKPVNWEIQTNSNKGGGCCCSLCETRFTSHNNNTMLVIVWKIIKAIFFAVFWNCYYAWMLWLKCFISCLLDRNEGSISNFAVNNKSRFHYKAY